MSVPYRTMLLHTGGTAWVDVSGIEGPRDPDLLKWFPGSPRVNIDSLHAALSGVLSPEHGFRHLLVSLDLDGPAPTGSSGQLAVALAALAWAQARLDGIPSHRAGIRSSEPPDLLLVASGRIEIAATLGGLERYVVGPVEGWQEKVSALAAVVRKGQRVHLFFPAEQFSEVRLALGTGDSPVLHPVHSLVEVAGLVQGILGGVDPSRCPFPGLAAYQESDAKIFFGRGADVERLQQRLGVSRWVTVIGPSGTGKSSLLRAGLVPRLRRAGWRIATLRPGSEPHRALALALAQERGEKSPAALTAIRESLHESKDALSDLLDLWEGERTARWLLLLDQLEEVFVADAQERAAFLALISAAVGTPRGRVSVIAAVRADFIERFMKEPALADALGQGVELVRPIAQRDLVEALERTAALVGVSWEAGLADKLAESVEFQPGMLPTVQIAATALWDARRGSTLTWTTWRSLGGLDGMLARRADEVIRDAQPGHQVRARDLLLRLVVLDSGGRPVRRRMSREALGALGTPEQELLNRLVTAGLVVTSEDGAELAHDALLLHWPRLATFLEADHERLRWMGLLSAATGEWTRSGHRSEDLWWGRRLKDAEDKLRDIHSFTGDERAFLEASARLQRRSRLFLHVPVAFAVLALVVVYWQKRPEIERSAEQTESVEIQRRVVEDPAGLRLRIEEDVSHDRRWWALQLARANGGEPDVFLPDSGVAVQAALNPAGDTLAIITNEGVLELRDVLASERSNLVMSQRLGASSVASVSWDDPGGQLCIRQQDGRVWSWDGSTLSGSPGAPVASTDPEVLSLRGACVVGDAMGHVRRFAGTSEPTTLADVGAPVTELRISAVADKLAIVNESGSVTIVSMDPDSGHSADNAAMNPPLLPAAIAHVDWTSDGAALAWVTDGGLVGLYDLATGQVVRSRETGTHFSALRVLRDDSMVGLTEAGGLMAWTSDGWSSAPKLRSFLHSAGKAVRGATRDLVFSDRGKVTRYDPHTNWFMESFQACDGSRVAFSRDADRVACVDQDGSVRVLPVRAGYDFLVVEPMGSVADIALTASGTDSPTLQILSRGAHAGWTSVPLDGSPRALHASFDTLALRKARLSHRGDRALLSTAQVHLQEKDGETLSLPGTAGALAMAWSDDDEFALIGSTTELQLWALPKAGSPELRWHVPAAAGHSYAAAFTSDAVILGTSGVLRRLSLKDGATLSETPRAAKELRIESNPRRGWLYTLDGELGAVQVRDAHTLEILGQDKSFGMEHVTASPGGDWTLDWDERKAWLILHKIDDRDWIPKLPLWLPFRPDLLQSRGLIGPNRGSLAEPAVAVAFSDDDRYVAVAASSGYIRVWNLPHLGSPDAGMPRLAWCEASQTAVAIDKSGDAVGCPKESLVKPGTSGLSSVPR